MKPRAMLPIGVALLATFAGATPALAQCDADGEVQFVCGIPGAEDLLMIPGTPWVLVSSRVSDSDGFLIAVDSRDLRATTIYPMETGRPVPAAGIFGGCPGGPARFQPHGIALREGGGGGHTLYVVGHGTREAVEVFTLNATGPEPAVTWVGCIVAPEGVSLNSVTPVPGGGIVVTNFNVAGGELWEWTLSDGWSEVPGSEMSGPNGVVSSPDGDVLYVGGWGEEAFVRISRGVEPVQREQVGVGYHIDNVRWAPDGSILAAGQYGPEGAAIGGCLNGGSCEGIAARVVRIDPATLAVTPLIDYPSNPRFPFGTVAIEVGDEIWVGGLNGQRIARFPR